LKSKEITVKIIHTGVGDISEADVMLAATSNAMIIGFKVKEDSNAAKVSATEDVKIRTYDIIYQISEDIEKTMLGLLSPEVREIELGKAEVRNLFTVGKNLVIAGCYVLEGKVVRNRTATVFRENKEIFRGNLDNLKRFKDDAKEVSSGYECGISFNKFNDLKEGDIIKVTTLEEIERENLN
jgi:translation initiation factor IF-2